MDRIVITGGVSVRGGGQINGGENATLAVFGSTVLGGGECGVYHVPPAGGGRPPGTMFGVLGAKVHHEGNRALINADVITSTQAPYDLVKTMRASVLVLGPLLARWGEATVSMPGGCAIGSRPVNLHLAGLAKMGADVSIDHGYIRAKAKRLTG